MILIIEGLDGVGKTTVAKEFASKYNFEYIKESYTDSAVEKKDRVLNMIYRLDSKKNYIYDRTTLIDDFVYDFLNQKESSLKNHTELIYKILSMCTIVHLQLDEQVRKERFDKRGDEYITNDDIKQIDKQYKQFYSNLKNVKYVTLTSDLDKDVNNIMEVIKND